MPCPRPKYLSLRVSCACGVSYGVLGVR
jgi:hypothetical protein